MRRLTFPLSGFFICLVLYYVLPWKEWGAAPAFAGLPFLIVFAIIIPGALINSFLAREKTDFLDRFAVFSAYGFAFLLFTAFIWSLFHGSLASYKKLWPLFILPLIALRAILPPAGDRFNIFSPRGNRTAQILALLVSLYVLALVLRSGPPLGFTKDTLDHVSYVREIRESGKVLPTDAFYKYAGTDGEDIRKGLLHFIYAFLGDYLGLETFSSLKYLGAFLAVLMLLSIYAAVLRLFKNRMMAALTLLLFLTSTSTGLSSNFIREMFYTNRSALVFFLFYLTFTLNCMDDRKLSRLLSVSIFAFAAAATHIFYGILVVFSLIVILIWRTCFSELSFFKHFKRVLILGLFAFIGVAPYTFFRYLTSYHGSNALHSEVQGVLFLSKSLFVIDPLKLFRWFGLFGMAAFLSIIPLWRHRRENPGLGYLLASSLSIPLVLLNPVLLPPLYKALSYLVIRITYLCPIYILAAAYLAFILAKIANAGRIGFTNGLITALLSISIIFNLIASISHNTFSSEKLENEKKNAFYLWKDGLTFLENELPKGSIITSDPITSYSITAFTGHYVVCTLDQHAPPNDLNLERRVRAARAIMSPFTSLRETTKELQNEKSRYIIINGRIPAERILHYWSVSPKIIPNIRAKFFSRPDIFKTIFDEKGFTVIEWNSRQALEDTLARNPYAPGALPEGYQKAGLRAGVAKLEAFKPFRGHIKRKEALELNLAWLIDKELPLGNYNVSIRFNYIDLKLPFKGLPFPKISRKLKEKLSGTRFRFRSDHKIASGFLSPDLWTPGALFLDNFQVSIPRDIKPGRYEVSVKLLKHADQPVYRLRDLLYDEDIYEGVPIGDIDIE